MKSTYYTALLIIFAWAPSAPAGIVAYSSSATQTSNQSYGNNFGMDFSPNVPVAVTELGLYSSAVGNGTGTGFAGDDFVTLFSSGGAVLAQLEFGNGTGNGTLVAGTSDYLKLLGTPVVLTVGSTYSIVAHYGNGTDQLANVGGGATAPAETGSPYISYLGGGRFATGGDKDTYPTTIDGGPANRYNGPTFAFVTPEPSSLVVWGLVLAGGLVVARRRKV